MPSAVPAPLAFTSSRPWRDEPDPGDEARVQRAYESGLILLSRGTSANTIRILVPLTAEDAIVDDGLDVLEQALAA